VEFILMQILEKPFKEIGYHKDFMALCKEYADESAVVGAGEIKPDLELYSMMERAGIFKSVGVFNADKLVGFMFILSAKLPHYSAIKTTIESIFLKKEYRNSKIGKNLLQLAEDYAKLAGSDVVIASAPVGGVVSKILPKCGYRNTNLTFIKNV
jgi:GNAT superfamily N-acetyltransferase